MAIEVELPDGTVVEFPDGTDNATMERALSQYRARPTQQEPARANPSDGMSHLDRFRAGFGKAFADTASGVKQAATESLARGSQAIAGTADAVGLDSVSGGIARSVGAPLRKSLTEQQAAIDETRRLDAPLMDTWAGFLGNLGGQVAQMAVPVGGAATLTGRLGLAAAHGGAFAGAQPTATGESRALNTASGAGLGLAGQGVASGLGRLATRAKDAIPEAVQQSIDLARRAGIPLNVAQTTQSLPIRAAQGASKWLPFSGATNAIRNQQEAFNAAVGRSFGADAKYLTDDVMRRARQDIGKVFEDVYSRNDVALSPDALRKLVAIESSAGKRLTESEAQVVRNQLDEILNNAENGALTGQKYQAVRTALQKAEGNDKTGAAVKELRKALDDIAAEAIGPDDAARLAKSRGQWANMRVVEDALRQVTGAAGNVRPAALWPLIRKGSTKEMRELAKIGQNVLKEGVGDSGTAQKQFYTNLATGTGGLGTAAGLGMLLPLLKFGSLGVVGGRVLNSNTASKLLQQGRPTSALAQLSQQSLPRALPTAAPRLSELAGLTVAGGRVATPEEIAADEEIVRRFREGR